MHRAFARRTLLMATTIRRMRETVQWTSGINIVAGLWLIIAPFVLGYDEIQAALWNDVVVGIIVAAFAVARVARPLMNPSLSWINAVLGLWLIVAPFVLAYGGQIEALAAEGAVGGAQTAMWNDVIVGVIVLVLGAWSALSSRGRTV
jgi:SPW repeat